MASDDPPGTAGRRRGCRSTARLADVAEAERVFSALADGGEITQPLAETFFSPKFGMCVDRFGTPWMVSTDAPQQ